MKKVIEASVLAFDKNYFKFKKLAKEMKENNINNIHYDVMDGVFVPNTAYNGEKLKYLKKMGFEISVHLMVQNVEEYVRKFVYYDIDYLTFHCEPIEKERAIEVFKFVRGKGIKCGIAIKPKTKIEDVVDLIKMSEIITIMGVEPGFGGQKYIPEITEKLKQIKTLVADKTIIQLDGGVNTEIIKLTKNYVDYFVSGSFLVKTEDKKSLLDLIK